MVSRARLPPQQRPLTISATSNSYPKNTWRVFEQQGSRCVSVVTLRSSRCPIQAMPQSLRNFRPRTLPGWRRPALAHAQLAQELCHAVSKGLCFIKMSWLTLADVRRNFHQREFTAIVQYNDRPTDRTSSGLRLKSCQQMGHRCLYIFSRSRWIRVYPMHAPRRVHTHGWKSCGPLYSYPILSYYTT
jgi:hypothetical protein